MEYETRLSSADLAAIDDRLVAADAALARAYPGDPGTRQPVHTVYVPADRFHAELIPEWGATALAALAAHASTPAELGSIVGLGTSLAAAVFDRVALKLAAEPIEDLRVDFEDGYGHRPAAEEDAAAVHTAVALAGARAEGALPPFVGLRVKSLEPATRRRGLRTLDLFIGAMLADAPLPDGFVITFPKVTAVEQVMALVDVCARLEAAYRLPAGRLRFELQIETPQSVLGASGTVTVAQFVHASAGRCVGLHYGTYDYTAAIGVAGGFQSLEHPAADQAKALMQIAAAGTGVRLSDGSTNVLPVGSKAAVLEAWRLHARLVRRSLERAFYQGWDLHPAQLPTRFAATYGFYREALPAAAARLRAYLDKVAGGVLDEPATARALADVLVRGLDCGAVDEAEVLSLAGLDADDLRRMRRGSVTPAE
jgi:HpcH/HpaI aldolase/citrate lyase family